MSLHLLFIISVDIPMVIHHSLESHYQTMDLPAIDVPVCACVLYMCVYMCVILDGRPTDPQQSVH